MKWMKPEFDNTWEGGSPDVDVILGRVVTYWWWLITKGVRGVKNLGKSDYVISESP